jgi:hypothetical protein
LNDRPISMPSMEGLPADDDCVQAGLTVATTMARCIVCEHFDR